MHGGKIAFDLQIRILLVKLCQCLLQDSNNNTHLNPEEITENNIDEEIKNVGRRWGMNIEKKYKTGRSTSESGQLGHDKGITGAPGA